MTIVQNTILLDAKHLKYKGLLFNAGGSGSSTSEYDHSNPY